MTASIKEFSPQHIEESKFVEVLTSDMTGDLIGYRVGGGRSGPSAVLAGDPALIDALFDRFMALPTLPWMWGRLYLVSLDSVAAGNLHALTTSLPDVQVDGLIMLPYAAQDDSFAASIESGYWTGLRLCRQLGMIEGRGVQSRSSDSVVPFRSNVAEASTRADRPHKDGF